MFEFSSSLVSGVTHSALGDMKTITQESKPKVITSGDIQTEREVDNFFTLDEYYSVYASNNKPSSRHDEIIVVMDEPPKRAAPQTRSMNVKSDTRASSNAEGEAQKKFGSAKAISSEQYFQDSTSDNAVRTNSISLEKCKNCFFIIFFHCQKLYIFSGNARTI